MARKTFFSFHYKPDNWRASQVRNMGVIEGNKPVSDNDWETITGGGDKAIKEWIEDQLAGKSCAVVLVGAGTAGRKWITYEIKRAWDLGKGVVGIRVHNLKDRDGEQSSSGGNPFFHVKPDDKRLSTVVELHDPPYSTSKRIYEHIEANIADWVEDAIKIRDEYE